MAIPEACGLWIEQRIQEELEVKGETGSSLREIGRQVAAEVEKYFETRVNPRTIEKRAGRLSATNVAPKETPTKTVDNPEIKEIKRQPAKDGTMRGGARTGAGRKPKPAPKKEKHFLELLPEQYHAKYNDLFDTVGILKRDGWPGTTEQAVRESIEAILTFMDS